MGQGRKLLYVGNDGELFNLLKDQHLRNCRWHSLDDPYQVVQKLGAAPTLDDLAAEPETWEQCYQDRYAGVILDTDLSGEKAAEILRSIKSHDGGIPVIMLTRQTSLASVCLARLDGAEACFVKPLQSPNSLLHAIQEALQKHRRWEQSLQAALSFEPACLDNAPQASGL